MRNSFYYFILISLLYACSANSSQKDKSHASASSPVFKSADVDSVLVKQKVPDGQMVEFAVARVTGSAKDELVNSIIGADKKGICKCHAKYILEAYGKGNVLFSLISNGSSFKYASSVDCFEFNSKNYLDRFFK